jgi:hypothetical protein
VTATPDKIPTKRIIIGAIVFITGFLVPLLVPFIAKSNLSLAWKTTLSGLLIFGIPELFMIIAVAIMGKEGFNHLKSRFYSLLKKHGPPEQVSPLRYKIGLVFFIIPLVLAWLLPYIEHYLSAMENYKIYLNIGGDVMLFISLLILGGEFWEKIRALFIQDKIVQLKE